MRKCSLLPSYSGRCSLPSMLALAQLSLLAISCATVAGFEDFRPAVVMRAPLLTRVERLQMVAQVLM